eukprot:TRINITY_DN1959_c0_g1_i8.p1 TRINITY_DN1959_c0_g1~~TRINITY_DN1959_c0_g1_i8.p1  ORF type:complete len:284 (+),score=45.88 TRINITY_DN1959_c0_g1_i8:51-902(+)
MPCWRTPIQVFKNEYSSGDQGNNNIIQVRSSTTGKVYVVTEKAVCPKKRKPEEDTQDGVAERVSGCLRAYIFLNENIQNLYGRYTIEVMSEILGNVLGAEFPFHPSSMQVEEGTKQPARLVFFINLRGIKRYDELQHQMLNLIHNDYGLEICVQLAKKKQLYGQPGEPMRPLVPNYFYYPFYYPMMPSFYDPMANFHVPQVPEFDSSDMKQHEVEMTVEGNWMEIERRGNPDPQVPRSPSIDYLPDVSEHGSSSDSSTTDYQNDAEHQAVSSGVSMVVNPDGC